MVRDWGAGCVWIMQLLDAGHELTLHPALCRSQGIGRPVPGRGPSQQLLVSATFLVDILKITIQSSGGRGWEERGGRDFRGLTQPRRNVPCHRVSGSDFGFRVQRFGSRVSGSMCRDPGVRFRVQDSYFHVSAGSGFKLRG